MPRRQRPRAGVLPQRLERLLDLGKGHVVAQRHVAVHMDFEGGVVRGHGLYSQKWLAVTSPWNRSQLVPRTGIEPVRPMKGGRF